jgi:8-hydroxy-5-deazaflavin:NADPH oxidoreductase
VHIFVRRVRESARIGFGFEGGHMRIGIIGAGKIGSTLAKLWVDAGHEVRLASRHPDALEPLVGKLGEHASTGTPVESASFGDVVLLAVPLKAIPDLARDLAPALTGKVVVDAGNAYEQRDGQAAREATGHPKGSAGWAAAMCSDARWVKGFNTVTFKVLEREAHRDGDRVGIPLASDSPQALDLASQLVRDAGFDPVIVGALARGREFEPGTRPYDTGMSGTELRTHWAAVGPRVAG